MNAANTGKTPWLILTSRYGGDTRNPTREDVARAIRELYSENLPGMTQADYEEHGAAFLRHGYDDGPMYVLEIARNHSVQLEEWADQDFEVPLSPPRIMHSVSETAALALSALLAEGNLESLRNEPWEDVV